MKRGFVADASVGISWSVLSQSSAASDRLLNDVASGRPFVVPVLWTFEVANSLLVLLRRKRLNREQYLRARRALSRLNPLIDENGPRAALAEISELAERHALSIYDAAYLELALRRDLAMASRDAHLNRAAGLLGVETLL